MAKPVNIKTEVLNDLASRFLINIPDEDKDDPIKLCSHIEVAHWFYLDLIRPEDPSLPACSMREFMATIFQHCPFLVRDSTASNLDGLIAQWKSHKYKKPVRGAIILNQDWTKCLLVQGYPASTSWGFPKGKLEKGEKDLDTAVREVYEETGFDSRSIIREDWYLEARVNDCDSRMYIIPGVSETTKFGAKTRKEIRAIEWFPIDSLPKHKKDLTSKHMLGKSANNFFMIIPFMAQLRKWLASQQKTAASRLHKNKTISASFQNPVQPQAEVSTQQKSQSLLAQPALSRSPILPTPPQVKQSQSGSQFHQNHYQNQPLLMNIPRPAILPTPVQTIPAGTSNRFPVMPPPPPRPQMIQSHSQVQHQLFHQSENQYQTPQSRSPILPTPTGGVGAVNPTQMPPLPMATWPTHVQYQQYHFPDGTGYGHMYPDQRNPAVYRSHSDPRQVTNIRGFPPSALVPVSRSNTTPIPYPPPHMHTPHTNHTIPAPLQQLSGPYVTTVYPTHLAYGNTHNSTSYYQQTVDHNNFNPLPTSSTVNASTGIDRESQETTSTESSMLFKPSLNFQNFAFDTNSIFINSGLRI